MMSKRIPNLRQEKQILAIPIIDQYKRKVILLILSIVFALLAGQKASAQIAAWDFTGVNTAQATVAATVFNSNLVSGSGANNITRGATAGASAAGNSFRTTGFQNNGIATSNTDYFQITLTASSTFKVSLSTIDARFNGTATYFASPGVTSQFAYSLDGTNFTLIGSPVTTTSLTMTQISLTGISALQNVAAGTTITLRYYASGQTNTGGWGFTSPSAGAYGLAIGGTVATTGTSAVLANITTQPSGSITQGNSNVVLAGFKITPSTSVDFTAVTVTGAGTATVTDITSVRIFKDNDASGTINGADASVSGSGVAYAASMPMTITGETGLSAESNYLIVADVAGVGVSTTGRTVTASVGSGAFTTTASSNTGSASGNSRTIAAPPGTSTITAGAGTEPATISSLTNTQGAASLNFDFTIKDDGATPATDNASTLISQIVFGAGTGNTVTSWSTAIAGVELSDGTNTTTTATIGTSSITFAALSTASGAIGEVTDNATKTYSLKIWLKADLTTLKALIDGQNFVFRIQNSSITSTGSAFAASQDVNSGATNNVVDVTASALAFVQQPTNANVGVAMSPAVTIAAVDANGNRDLGFTSSVRITSTGTLTGTPVDVAAVSGLATFSTLTHTAAATGRTLKAQRTSTLDWDVTSSTFSITVVPLLTEIILPQYAVNGTTTGARLPYVCRLGLSNLTPNATYRYLTAANGNAGNMYVINNTSGSGGYIVGYSSAKSLAGTLMGGDESTSGNRYGEFTADATGQYTGWFATVPTGNAVFNAGNTINITLSINDGAGGTTEAISLSTTSGITMIGTGTGATGGRAIRGSGNGVSENMSLLYGNTAGTGRPLWCSIIENDGILVPFVTWYDGSVNGVAGSWGAYIPTALPSGVRRIEQRSVSTGLIVACADTNSTGVWPTGSVNTVNPTGGTSPVLVISSTDASFTCPILNTITTETVSGNSFCIDEFTGAAISVPFTSTGTFTSGNIYTAQLSNSSGSFASPVNIGTLSSTANSGTISAEIPGATPVGTGYRIRVISSSPSITGSVNTSNIAVTAGSAHYIDIDGDGYGDDASLVITCTTPSGYVNVGGDCDDFTFAINPGATEVCDDVDNDCDTQVDEGVKLTFYADADGDTYGNLSVTTLACTAPSGYVSNSLDCDDNNNAVHPGATEVCDGIDNNCDAQIDEGVKTTFYRDADGDTYGNPSVTILACSAPGGYVNNNTDCDDALSAVHPGATEVCNGIDDNCIGGIDEGVKLTFYADADGDTYGDLSVTTLACSAPSGYASNSTDCDDNNAAVHPGATEVCDGIDNNCDAQIDEGVKTTFYRDADGDTYGNPSVTTMACSAPSGYVSNNTDCDDALSTVHPGAAEVCGNGIDDDCDGSTDEGCTGNVTLNMTLIIQGFYQGGGTMTPVLFNDGESSDPDAVDSVTVELRSVNDLETPFETATSVVKADGSITFSFSSAVSGNEYYIVVKHRNSVETWSKDPVLFSSTTTYDFAH